MKVVLYLWLIGTVATLPALALPFVVSTVTLPVCEAKAQGSSCILCGMTTAFFRIGQGQFSEAQVLNAGAVPLFAVLCLNALAAIIYGGSKCRS